MSVRRIDSMMYPPMAPKEARALVLKASKDCPRCGGAIIFAASDMLSAEDEAVLVRFVDLRRRGLVYVMDPEDAEQLLQEGRACPLSEDDDAGV